MNPRGQSPNQKDLKCTVNNTLRKKRKLRSGKYQSNMAKTFLSSKNKNLQIESVSFIPKKMNGTRLTSKYVS